MRIAWPSRRNVERNRHDIYVASLSFTWLMTAITNAADGGARNVGTP